MATRSITLRYGDARDVALVDALMTQAFDPRFGEAWTRGQCLGVLAMAGVRATLAFVDDDCAGFAIVRTVIDEAELLLLGVAPTYQGRGVGGSLLRAAIADCASDGTATMHLEVRAGNDAVRLYTTHGFAKVGERRAYYRGRTGLIHDAHTYRRTID